MATQKQIEANRRNAQKSTGPKSPDGKNVTKFNRLKHGLRAEQVVLPGEDPAAFEAERQAWLDDWRPMSHTRAVLAERAAACSWKLRRATVAEAAACRDAAERAARDFDLNRLARVERAVARFEDDPRAALSLLECCAAGLDRLIVSWADLEAAIARGPSGWDRPVYHVRLLMLLGYRSEFDPDIAGAAPGASARLLRAYGPTEAPAGPAMRTIPGAKPAPKDGPHGGPYKTEGVDAEIVRRAVAGELARLRELRARAADPDVLRQLAVEAAWSDTSPEAQMLHRYEMAHDRALRATIKQLLELDRSGADLPDEPEAEPEPAAEPNVEAVAGPAGRDAPEKPDSTPDASSSCGELASVGAAAPAEGRPGRPAGSTGRPIQPIGVDPGSGKAPRRG